MFYLLYCTHTEAFIILSTIFNLFKKISALQFICTRINLKRHQLCTELNIGPHCVQYRRSFGTSWKQSKRGVRDCTFDNICTCVSACHFKRINFLSTFEESIDRSIDRSINQSVNQSINQSTEQLPRQDKGAAGNLLQ